MGIEWTRTTLGRAEIAVLDCEHKTPKAMPEGIPYIAIPQMKEGRIDLSDVRRITDADYAEWTRRTKPESFDVILSRRCNPGETVFVPEGLKCVIGQNLVVLRASGKKVKKEYLRWLVKGKEWWEQIGKFLNVGAVFDSLRCADIPNFEITIPPLPTQEAIAHILGTLDDKIELLRSVNETLEAMARALFKSWFIDFDPVRRRTEGQPTGLPLEIEKLFPDSFENSELGEIPKGWVVEPYSCQVEVIGGGTPKTSVSEYWKGNIPWYSVTDSPRSHDVFVIDTDKHITDAAIRNSSTRILPIGTTIISARGTVGKLALTAVPMCINQSCYGVRWKSTGGDYYTYFSLVNIVQALRGMAHGSVFDTITRSTFESTKVVNPTDLIVRTFDLTVFGYLTMIRNNIFEIELLQGIRDSLLPKLISGDIEITDQMIKEILEPAT